MKRPPVPFPLGQLLATPAALAAVSRSRITDCLFRHASGDWGDLGADDCRANDEAVRVGNRVFSAYWINERGPERFWIITEADRSATTVLLPSDY